MCGVIQHISLISMLRADDLLNKLQMITSLELSRRIHDPDDITIENKTTQTEVDIKNCYYNFQKGSHFCLNWKDREARREGISILCI